MNNLLERLGGFAARRHWIFIIAWLVILGGTLWARHASGGEFVNNYSVSGSGSALGQDLLNKDFPQQGGYAGQIVFQAKNGTVSADQAAVNQATSNVAKLPDVIKAVSPFASPNSGAVSKDGTIAYSSVSWSVNPNSLETDYLNRLDHAVAPARSAGLQVAYGGGAGQIGQVTHDLKSEIIGLACALVLLVFMFGSLIAAAIPLLSAIFSVGAGLSLLGLLAAASTFPTTAPTIATLLGLGVAVDYGLFLMARHREQMDTGMDLVASAAHAEATSGAAIVVAGGTVVVSILGLYVSGVVFVGALGLAAAIVVAITMLAALTLVPAFMGVAGSNVRALSARFRARKAGISAQEQATRSAAATHEQHEHSAFARWGRKVSERPWPWAVASVAVLVILAIPLFWLFPSASSRARRRNSEPRLMARLPHLDPRKVARVDIIRYRTGDAAAALVGVRDEGQVFSLPGVPSLAALWALPLAEIRQRVRDRQAVPAVDITLLPPVDGRTEVWAAGVTYVISREARVEESERSADVYRQVYDAERPELFFKSAAWRVAGDGQTIAARADSVVDVPEPEVALVINRFGEIAGYTACNDVSSRSIEGENPLYLPQAKVYLGGCALGPAIRPSWEIADPYDLGIELTIRREGAVAWHGQASTASLRRKFDDLVGYLMRADIYPDGVVLATGTCLVPPAPFSLADGDVVTVAVVGIGTLTTGVVRGLDRMLEAFGGVQGP